MFNKSDRYINLKEGSGIKDRDTGIRFFPEYRVAELSGGKQRWIWNRPRGIILQKGSGEKRFPILDLTRIIQPFLYGISLILIMIGVGKMIGGQSAGSD